MSALATAPAPEGPAVDAGSGSPRGHAALLDQWLSLVALGTSLLAVLVLVGLSWADGGAGAAVRGLVLVLFWTTAPGGALLPRLALRPSTKLALTPLIGIGVLLTLATVGAWTGVWVPGVATALVALAVAAPAAQLVRERPLPRIARPGRPSRATTWLGIALLASLGSWAVSLPGIDHAGSSIYGLLASGPVTLPLAVLGVTAVLLAALRLRRVDYVVASAAAYVVVLRSTASVVNSVPSEAWSYKHIGVVAQLQDAHHVLAGTDIYMNWPAMFAGAAWFSDASGVAPLDLARWFTPLVHVLLALQVAALARFFGADALGAATAAALAVVLNWVGQDYFSPQAVAICLAGGFLLVLVQSRSSRTCAVLAVALFAVIVPTHQLTPFWLFGVAVVLTVLRRVRWLLPVLLLLVLIGYVLPRYDVVASYGLFTGFDPVGNAASNVPVSNGPGQAVGSLFSRGAAALMWATTLGVLVHRLHRAGWRRLWRTDAVLLPGVLAFSPFAILGGQSYGGEAVLRVVLYSTIGCAAVLGPVLAAAVGPRPTPTLRGRAGLAAAVSWVLVAVALATQITYGTWSINRIRSEDVAAAQWLADEHPDALVIPMLWDWPGRIAFHYQDFSSANADVDASLNALLEQLAVSTDIDAKAPTLATLRQVVESRPAAEIYLVTTASMRSWDAYYQEYEPGSYAALIADVRQSSDWALVRQDGGVQVYAWQVPS